MMFCSLRETGYKRLAGVTAGGHQLDLTGRLVNEKGTAALTMAEVAERIGLSERCVVPLHNPRHVLVAALELADSLTGPLGPNKAALSKPLSAW